VNLLERIRSTQARRGRRSLTLLVLAWLNALLQPCAMATAGDFAICPDCPPAHIHEQIAAMAEHDHAMVATGDDDGHSAADGHESDSGSATCGGRLVDCAHLNDINQTDRQKQLTLDPGLTWLAPPLVECPQLDDRRPPLSFGPGDAARLTGAFPPLNVLNCVYLD
jgi:hypothetical protein